MEKWKHFRKILSGIDRSTYWGKRDYFIMCMAFTTGIRQVSMRNLRWCDFRYEKETRWNSQKIWMALGALAVISIVGGSFATYFKELNKNQINESLQNVLSRYNIVVNYEK